MSTPARRRLIRDFKKLQQVRVMCGVALVLQTPDVAQVVCLVTDVGGA